MLKLDNVREGFLEPEEYQRFLGFLPFYLQMVLVIGYHWGMRRGEILKLRWDQVDWAAGVVRLERKQTKGKQARVAPIYGELRSWLERAFLERREGEVTIVSYRAEEHIRRPGENTGRPRKPGGVFDAAEAWGVTPKTARRILSLGLEGDELAAAVAGAQKTSANRRGQFSASLESARPASGQLPASSRPVSGHEVQGGLPGVGKTPAAGKPIQSIRTAWETARKLAGVPEILVHDLRRTAGRNMIRAGLDEKTAMRITGHKTAAMFRRYNIVDERDMVEAGWKMEVWARGADEREKKKPGARVEILEVRTKVRTAGEMKKKRNDSKGVYLQ